jgi:hypothetical protein
MATGERFMRAVRVLLVVLVVALAAAACSDDSKSDADSATTTLAPEDLRASDAEVATGLKKIQTTTADLAAATGTDKARAEERVAEIEPVWEAIEGTIKANDPDAYITFEDNFAILENAVEDDDATKAREGADTVSTAVTAYLAKYPG